MAEFIKGLKLCELFFTEAVKPILDSRFPDLNYSTGRLDFGSDVLGFDTHQSMDHGWGPKVTLFLEESDCEKYKNQISQLMADELPYEIHGIPTNFDELMPDGAIKAIDFGPVNHWVKVTTTEKFFEEYIGVNPVKSISEIDWLSIPQQRLRTISSGKIFYDGLNQLQAITKKLKWYPKDIWLYLMACQWGKISQEEPFMARCGDVGDELGSRLVASRQINELMKLCFLMEKQYAPYYKWFGTAFELLNCSKNLTPAFNQMFSITNWQEREKHLSEVYIFVAKMHNQLGITEEITPEVSYFFNRPYLVLHSEKFSEALYDGIASEAVKSLPKDIGAIWQFVDSTDVLDDLNLIKKTKSIYQC